MPQCGLARAKKLPQWYAGQLDGNGGMRVCVGVTLVSDLSDLSDLSDKKGASRYTPRACCAAVWLGAGEELPMGDYCSSAPQQQLS